MKTSEPNPNMQIWDALKQTDPAHTKGFTRGGGFKGTAIKPIYCAERMTAMFGPCGKGWGTGRPDFTIERLVDEVLVYCTIDLWYMQGGEKCTVYGVGGDKVLAVFSNGPKSDDEAFKKAYTDALGNAMKQIGMSADVHMGLFDDSKYVEAMKQEFHGEAPAADTPRPAKVIAKSVADTMDSKLRAANIPKQDIDTVLKKHGFTGLRQITEDKFTAVALEFSALVDCAKDAALQEASVN
jgi:hypothetical protein